MIPKTFVFIFGIGSGIGEGLIHRFQKEMDPNLFVFGFSRKGVKELNSFSLDSPGTYQLDVLHNLSLETFTEKVHSSFEKESIGENPFSILIYFALGDGLFGPVSDLTDKELQIHFDLNVVSLIKLSRSFARILPKTENSTFVFLGSTAGKQGFPESVAYCASKHAVLGIARALREEWKPFGTKVVHVSLGAVATEIWDTRPAFDKKDMVTVADISEYLWCISRLPKSIFVDDLSITPKKGIL